MRCKHGELWFERNAMLSNASVIDVQTRAGCDVSLDGSVYRSQTSFLCTTNKKKISDSDSKRFWLRGSGQSGPKLHCRNVVNILNAVDLLHPLWKIRYYLQGALVSLSKQRVAKWRCQKCFTCSHTVLQAPRNKHTCPEAKYKWAWTDVPIINILLENHPKKTADSDDAILFTKTTQKQCLRRRISFVF